MAHLEGAVVFCFLDDIKWKTQVYLGNFQHCHTLPGRLKSLKGTSNLCCNLSFARDTQRRPWHFHRGYHRGHKFGCSPGCIRFSFQGQSRHTLDVEHSHTCCLPKAGDIFLSHIHLLTEEPVSLGVDWCLARVDLAALSQEGSQSHAPSGLWAVLTQPLLLLPSDNFSARSVHQSGSLVVPAKGTRIEVLKATLVRFSRCFLSSP